MVRVAVFLGRTLTRARRHNLWQFCNSPDENSPGQIPPDFGDPRREIRALP